MAVKSSGTNANLSFTTDIVGEFGGTAPHSLSEYKRGGSLVPSGPSANANIPTTNADIQFSDFFGAVNEVDLSQALTPVTINGQSTAKQITVSDYIDSGGSLTIPSSLWVWTDSTSVAALIIDIPCTITNSGKIIGQGGDGAYGRGGAGQAGGPAIKINSGVSGVTIINNSGAYIAGGGGGGAGYEAGGAYAGGGGGSGGGRGAPPSAYINTYTAGGAINATGSDGADTVYTDSEGNGTTAFGGHGGGSGGEGGEAKQYGDTPISSYGGGGGRILPGTGGTGNIAGDGGSAGNSGGNGSASKGAGGGGGWGASGGNGYYNGTISGGAGGKAVEDSGVTYTLTNNGTIYGAT